MDLLEVRLTAAFGSPLIVAATPCDAGAVPHASEGS
jgi:hypothetical protein